MKKFLIISLFALGLTAISACGSRDKCPGVGQLEEVEQQQVA